MLWVQLLNCNIIAIELRTAFNMFYPSQGSREVCSICIPPNPDFIKPVDNNIADLVTKADEYMHKMKMANLIAANSIKELYYGRGRVFPPNPL